MTTWWAYIERKKNHFKDIHQQCKTKQELADELANIVENEGAFRALLLNGRNTSQLKSLVHQLRTAVVDAKKGAS